VRRRAFLSVCTAAAIGGCPGRNQQQESRIVWVWLVNDRDDPYEVDVTIEDAGETVFSRTYTVGTEGNAANFQEDGPVDGPGQYVVRAKMDGSVEEVDTTEHIDGDENCIDVRFSLLNNGMEEHWTRSMQEC